MELPLIEFNVRDLVRDLYGRALNTKGSKDELYDRVIKARNEKTEAQAQGFARPGRTPVTKFGVCVQPDDFANIECMTDEEYTAYSRKVQWRLRRVHKTYDNVGLEYYHPGVLHRIDRTKTYTLNINEFWVRQEPYLHKIFVVFVSRANGEEQRLCFARSLVKMREKDMTVQELKKPLITIDAIGRALCNIMMEIEDNGLANYVAVVTPKQSLLVQALQEIRMVTRQKLPPTVLDSSQLQKLLGNIFCAKTARCLYRLQNETFLQTTHKAQLEKLSKNLTQNIEAAALLNEIVKPLPDVLGAMWKIEEHRGNPICLARLNNERLNTYAAQVQNDLPPITFEDCLAGGGLLQLLLFDALWCMCDGNEIEENNTTAILEPPMPDEWLPLLN